ncbi:MAG: FAD-dependent oxidoreductase [Candidatus Binatia bacterium]
MAGAGRHLILIGGGHTHLFVLEAFARRGLPGAQVTLVSPSPRSTYSGMVPGVIARQYPLRAAQIDVARLAARAGGSFHAARAVGIDPVARAIHLDDGRRLTYDLASFDIGARTPLPAHTGAYQSVIPIKPIEPAMADIDAALAAHPSCRAVVIGAGAGGAEVAFALAARLRRAPASAVALCDRAAKPVESLGPRAAHLVERALAEADVHWIGGVEVEGIDSRGVRLRGGRTVAADLVISAAGAGPIDIFASAGLPVDERGCALVGDDLRSIAHPEIFAAGDCATLTRYPDLPKAGVHAVRQGPILAHNLRAAPIGGRMRRYRPQRRMLALLNTADGRAILAYGALAAHNRAAWWLKDRIDRGFVRRFDRP